MAKKKISELPPGVAVTDADLLAVVQDGVTRKVERGDLVPAASAPDSDDVTYVPSTLANWNTSTDPGDVEQALDQLAARAKTLETTVPTHVHDSDDITYTPTVLADWNSSADPGDVEQALDQLAERVKDTEGVISGAIGDGDKGDIVVSSSGTVWTIDSGVVTVAKLATAAKECVISAIIDGGGSTITTGVKLDIEVPFGCTINRVTLLADQSGAIVIDIWKDTYANYPPVDGDSITASAPPTISASGVKSQDSTLTGWTTTITAGDTLRFNVDSVTSITRCLVSLKVTRS